MKKLFTKIMCLFFLGFGTTLKAQVLFSEDFDSYPAGHLNTDYTFTTPGQGGWLVSRVINSVATAMVTPETGKGNVLSITTSGNTQGQGEGTDFTQVNGNILWNSRTAGYNICKFEYEVYTDGTFITAGTITGTGTLNNGSFAGFNFRTALNFNDICGVYQFSESSFAQRVTLKNYKIDPFPYNMWIKAEVFVDYNTKDVYFYLPTLNLQTTYKFTHNKMPEGLSFGTNSINASSVVKYDNIKVSALQTLPSYILNTNEQLAAKFNLYPNPANNVVNITNNENMLVNQVAVYDTTGKLINTQSFNEQTELQLNVENLASGTYMLHLQTAEGTAVKKLVKK